MSSIFDNPDTRVMTYNLKNGGDIPHWERRKTILAETIRKESPTILGTQEGFEFQLAYLREELQHYSIYGEGRDPFIGGEYCAVFVDDRVAEVHENGTFWLSPTPDVPGSKMPGENLPRIATWVKMTVHDSPLLYVNTHLTYVREGIPAQLAVITDWLEKNLDPSIETIITGDFNIGRNQDEFEPLRKLGFEEAWTLAVDTAGPVFTTPVWDLFDDDAIAAVKDENRIDWICVRPPDGETTPPVAVETLHTHRVEPVPSDHFPVVLRSAPVR